LPFAASKSVSLFGLPGKKQEVVFRVFAVRLMFGASNRSTGGKCLGASKMKIADCAFLFPSLVEEKSCHFVSQILLSCRLLPAHLWVDTESYQEVVVLAL